MLDLTEYWYDDGNFQLRENEPTDRQRIALSKEWAKNLRNTRSFTDPARFMLADKLENCHGKHRCWLAACPQCSHAYQRWINDQALRVLAPFSPLSGLTIVPEGLQRHQASLSTLKVPSAHRHLRRLLDDAGVPDAPMIGLMDLSYNIHSQRAWEPVFQPHYPLLLPDSHADAISKGLRRFLEKRGPYKSGNQPINRPIRRHAIIDLDWQGSYIFKYRPVQKTWFEAVSRNAHPTEQWLQPQQLVETLLWYGDQTPDIRLFMVGIRRYGQSLMLL